MKRKDLFGLHFHVSLISEASQGRNLESGTEADALEEGCLPACSSWLA